MKAVRVLEYGGQLVFDEVPTPTIGRDEVLVQVTGTTVNHVDLVKASGVARQVLPIDLPWIPTGACPAQSPVRPSSTSPPPFSSARHFGNGAPVRD